MKIVFSNGVATATTNEPMKIVSTLFGVQDELLGQEMSRCWANAIDADAEREFRMQLFFNKLPSKLADRRGSEASTASTSFSLCSGGDSQSNTSEEKSGIEESPQVSVGSVNHDSGSCRPCVWFWRPSSCNKGSSCEYCHLCDRNAVERAIKSRPRKNRQRRPSQ